MYRIAFHGDGGITVTLASGDMLYRTDENGSPAKFTFVVGSLREGENAIVKTSGGSQYPLNSWLKEIAKATQKIRDKTPNPRVYRGGGFL